MFFCFYGSITRLSYWISMNDFLMFFFYFPVTTITEKEHHLYFCYKLWQFHFGYIAYAMKKFVSGFICSMRLSSTCVNIGWFWQHIESMNIPHPAVCMSVQARKPVVFSRNSVSKPFPLLVYLEWIQQNDKHLPNTCASVPPHQFPHTTIVAAEFWWKFAQFLNIHRVSVIFKPNSTFALLFTWFGE